MGAFRFIHSSDLHLGRRFANLAEPPDGNIRGRLIEARHGAIGRLAAAARATGAAHVLLAGDTFDTARAQAAADRRVKSAERLRDAVSAALREIHAILTPEQRGKLAYLIRTGALSV